MAKLTFDPKRIELVSMDKIVPNDWNPKDIDTPEYEKIKASIEINGLQGAIITREYEGKHQVVDGMQRYTASKELGIPKAYIYNLGKVSDQRARELTIWWQQQVPFNRIEEAYLVVQIEDMGEPIQLPYNEIELEDLRRLANFNFDQYEKDPEDSENGQDNADGTKTFSVKLQPEAYETILDCINAMKDENNYNDGDALLDLVKFWQAGGE